MFDILKMLVPDLNPTQILLDFEKASIKAAITSFPQADIKDCYFHLCQSLLRKVNSVGLG